MFYSSTPESAGIKSENVSRFLKALKSHGLYMHSVLMAKGDGLFCEAYYKPFTRDYHHRMYSATKSYIGIAVSELAARGKISFDDKITDYFKDKLPEKVHPYLAAQTIRHMLAMQTSIQRDPGNEWYRKKTDDRVAAYFKNIPNHYPGTGFWYDSDGSFILSALVERVTGKSVMEFLREICLDEIGFSKQARFLNVVGGHSWGDSGLLCRPYDTLLFARLLANDGVWNGKRILSEQTVTKATGNYTSTNTFGISGFNNQNYGYQIWHTYNGDIMFLGMHCQIMIYDKKHDIIFVCNGGNPGGVSSELIAAYFRSEICDRAEDGALPENNQEYQSLINQIGECEIPTAQGEAFSDCEIIIDGKRFICGDNPMGITEFTLNFNESGGEFKYKNKQGSKAIAFGRKNNLIQQFPQTGYSRDVGGLDCEGNTYRCAASAAWSQPNRLSVTVQIIDEYIGLLNINIGFNGVHAWLEMQKDAENFLNEYNGHADAVMQ